MAKQAGGNTAQRVEALLEDAESRVRSYALIPRGIDSEARTLLAEASVNPFVFSRSTSLSAEAWSG